MIFALAVIGLTIAVVLLCSELREAHEQLREMAGELDHVSLERDWLYRFIATVMAPADCHSAQERQS